jgi:DNA-binding protein H-NS
MLAFGELRLRSPEQGIDPAAPAAGLEPYETRSCYGNTLPMPENADAPAVDLDRMSVQQLTALIADAEAKRRDKLEDAKAALRAEMERKAAELGIAPGDLFSTVGQQAPAEQGAGKNGTRARKPRGDTGAKRAAKYRGPNGEEWSGRGRMPNWLAALEAEGRKREEFLIQD